MGRKHVVVNGLHCITENGKVHVYTEQEYKDREDQCTWWTRTKRVLTDLGAGASWAIKN
jgi:hypothetical protein